MKPKVSVIMSVYNGSNFLDQAIDHVLKQTFSDFEFIIVDDKSTDNSPETITAWMIKDSRIKIIKNDQNIGLTKSLNNAIRESGGEYIARIDVDDICYPERIANQVAFLDVHQGYALVGSWAEIIDYKNNILRVVKYPTECVDLKKDLIKYNPFFHSSIMIRKSVLDDVGLYNENFKFAQDYELYFRIAKKYDLANLPLILIRYRESIDSVTSRKNRKQISLVIKAKLKALGDKQYPKWCYIYLIKDCLAWLIPIKIKKIIKKLFHP